MGSPWVTHGRLVGQKVEPSGRPVGGPYPWAIRRCVLQTHRRGMGSTHGLPMGYPWTTHGLTMGHYYELMGDPRITHGQPVGYTRTVGDPPMIL